MSPDASEQHSFVAHALSGGGVKRLAEVILHSGGLMEIQSLLRAAADCQMFPVRANSATTIKGYGRGLTVHCR